MEMMEGKFPGEAMEEKEMEGQISRRYFCKYCGISRSKKYLISSHVLSHHQDEISEEDESIEGEEAEEEEGKSNNCEECGASFRKPAYLKQHLRSHSLEVGRPPEKLHQAKEASITLLAVYVAERPFKCSVDGCHASYRRKDHLNRHFVQHKGSLFKCPIESCSREFVFRVDLKTHVLELHDEHCDVADLKPYVCEEPGCGKAFHWPSKLKKHQDSHVKLDSSEAVCLEPGCGKHFSNEQCLKAHIQASHQYMNCEICGGRQLKKNIRRHLRSHETGSEPTERVGCDHDGCGLTFSSKTNLNKHVKAVHLEVKPFACGFPGCGMRFSYKHVRDNHEKSGCHVYTCGDFEESDEQFRSRPRGGLKRRCPSVETLLSRKRVTLPPELEKCY